MSIFLSARLQSLRSAGRETRLDFFPETLTILEVVQVILVFVFRQLLYLFGIGGNVRAANGKDGEDFSVPEVYLSMPFRITKEKLKEYASAVGLENIDVVFASHAQQCLLLSAFSEPAMLLLLANRGCPVRPLGSVNVRNRFDILVPRLCTQEALLNMQEAELRATTLKDTRKMKRGLEIDLEVQIVHLGEDIVIFSQVFTMLQFMKVKQVLSASMIDVTSDSTESDWDQASTASFCIAVDAPMAWARICKDYNLLHISGLAARLSGFPGRIAHGNHALALAVARLDLEKRYSKPPNGRQDGRIVMEVQFRKPMALPANLSAQVLLSGKAFDFRIMKGDRICVTSNVKHRVPSGDEPR